MIMDRISLKEMKLFGYTGCLPEEKKNGQYFYVTVDMYFRDIPGRLTDDLKDTVNYANVYYMVEKLVSTTKFDLIEHLAYKIGRSVIAYSRLIDSVRVLVRKPDAPVDGTFDSMETEITVRRREAVIGFGGNMGERDEIIKEAIDMLKYDPAIDLVNVSSLYETEPVGYEDQADFLNGCAVIRTYLEPLELLKVLQKIENELHRVRTIKNGPRTIDLDLLLMQGVKMDTNVLTIPHPRMYERAFVLVPLKELGYYHGPIPDDKEVRPTGIRFEV
jgi:dihydroneopterin aldolase/2-amino-4-hydroxy-6-hydroxymethyldihydropteridine diphosphokinase